MHPKTKFLTTVWGEAYIARFASLALPSFLAPGNLPALAAATDLEIVIMTRHKDIAYFEEHSTFQQLRKICPLRFIEIDDLITTTVYGVTLTLAYARPIIACGDDMVNTHFVFMNADFVLADGSLRSLSKHILAGRSIVLGPSFRATAEEVEPLLESAIDTTTGVLSIPPRQMVGLTLRHPHATTAAKMQNQGLCHSTHPNQFFWRIDEQTLLARYYLIFMLCLKPEQVIDSINSYCDYAFIPEMCPSGDEVVMCDSDDFFMLELQQRMQEKEMLRLGRQSETDIANSLQYWTTAEHRRTSSHNIVFHAGEIPDEIEATKAEAQAFIDRINDKLGRPARHAGHKYWVRGVEAWMTYRKAQDLSFTPPELATEEIMLKSFSLPERMRYHLLKWAWRLAYQGYYAIMGSPGQLTPMNPEWLDQKMLRDTLAKIFAKPNQKVLIVRRDADLVDRLIPAHAEVQFVAPTEILANIAYLQNEINLRYHHTLIYLPLEDYTHLRSLLKKYRSIMEKDGECHVVIYDDQGAMNSGEFLIDLLSLIESAGGTDTRSTQQNFVGGIFAHMNRRLFSWLGKSFIRFGPISLLAILPLLLIGLPLVLVTNIYLGKTLVGRRSIDHCTSLAIHFSPAKSVLEQKSA